MAKGSLVTEAMKGTDDRRVVACNYTEGTKIASSGALAYVVLTNRGGGSDRCLEIAGGTTFYVDGAVVRCPAHTNAEKARRQRRSKRIGREMEPTR